MSSITRTTNGSLQGKGLLVRRLALITAGSLFFVCLKTGLVALIHATVGLAAWLNYLTVTVAVTLLGWVYHSKLSFQVPLNRKTLGRFVQQAVALKAVDYALYNGLVYVLRVALRWAVLLTGGVVFSVRVFVYMAYVFRAPRGDLTETGPRIRPAAPDTANGAVGGERSLQETAAFSTGRGNGACRSPYVGDALAVFCGYASRVDDRVRVASGGLATMLLATALRDGVVDAVAVSRADFSQQKIGYVFDLVRDPDRVRDYGSSAYFNIPVEKHWKQIDQFEGRVALCALPCHTRILRRRREDGRGLKNVGLFISLFCGHNNEADLLRFVFEKEGIPERDVSEMSLDRTYLGGDLRVSLRDGSSRTVPFRRFNVYRSLGFFSKPMCRYCDDHLGAQSDLSIGDVFVREYRGKPVKHSAVIARTEKGLLLLRSAADRELIRLEEVDADVVFRAQKRVIVPSGDLKSRYYACRWLGFPARAPRRGRFRLRSFLTYSMLNLNDRISQSAWGRRLLKHVPRPVLYGYVAVIKLVNHTLKPQS